MSVITVGSNFTFAEIQAAIDNSAGWDTIVLNSGAYTSGGVSYITVNKPMTIVGYGATLFQDTSGGGALYITSDDVTVKGLEIVGPQNAVAVGNEKAIQAYGASATVPIKNLKCKDLRIRRWGYIGFWLSYVERFVIRDCEINNIARAGLVTLSCSFGTIDGNYIHDMTQPDNQVNSYGIQLTRYQQYDMVVSPRSHHITVSNNHIDGVPKWEGIDTHAGAYITISNNTVLDTKVGIAVVGCPDETGVDLYGPKYVTVTGNTIDSGVTDGSRDAGIQFVGPTPTVGNCPDWGTGTIVGNTIIGHGRESSSTSGAIQFYGTKGLVVSGNSIFNAGNGGILAYHTNYGYNISSNTIQDVWSISQINAVGIYIRNSYNSGYIGDNVIQNTGYYTDGRKVLTYGAWVYNAISNLTSWGELRVSLSPGTPTVTEGANASSTEFNPAKVQV